MDTANTHDDTIDEATQPFERGTTADASVEKQHPEAPDDGLTTPPTSGRPLPPHHPRWSDRLTTPAAGWVATAIATILAAAIRLPGLDNVRTLIFDETYYVKDAWSLLTLGYEGTWAKDVDAAFATGDVSGLSTVGGYPVHPPTGKWLIALGMKIFGQADPVGWRIAAAICGIITVFLLCRLTQILFRTPALTLLAGLFLATDGMAIVMSRTSILDGFLTMFALAAFLCVAKDQEASRPRLLAKLREWDGLGAPRQGWPDLRAYLTRQDRRPFTIGPNASNRPWLLAAGVLAGLASSVKWSGIYLPRPVCGPPRNHVPLARRSPLPDPRRPPRRHLVGIDPHGSHSDPDIHRLVVRMVCPPRRARTRSIRNPRLCGLARRPVALPQGNVDIP